VGGGPKKDFKQLFMIQIKIMFQARGQWAALNAKNHTIDWGYGYTIQEAIEDFLKINKLQNVKYKWS